MIRYVTPAGDEAFYECSMAPDLEDVPDPWLIPEVDTRKPWECPVLWKRAADAVWDDLVRAGEV
jgi:hypothetical protein